MNLRPWGSIGWLLPKIGIEAWHVITSASFEDRCIALVDLMNSNGPRIKSSTLYKISNPPSESWTEAAPVVKANFDSLSASLSAQSTAIIEADLLSQLGSVLSLDQLNPDGSESVVLDITTLPKRFFLFALKQLVNSAKVQNLVVTYAAAKQYPEAALCENALPPAALQGFGRVQRLRNSPRMFVGVGYTALSIEGLLEKAGNSKLDFLFPFPPASPAFRRNWYLLSKLMPADKPFGTEIHRVHGMDAFEVFERLYAWGQFRDLDLVPLGPKPHALGMAMASMRLEGTAELIYAQPQSYHVNYSQGIALDESGRPKIYAYCLKHRGKVLF
ncbi:hypothetical protein [Paraburkholderia sp. BCC1886]|uniref:hypothetical protein n=1 Tax=Paraburkholderia sp. BCC1886 TaxID=2562670 RepID=UPI001182DE15|nr:hypothetical protein [Paraburkholderia sp. BCC1886]